MQPDMLAVHNAPSHQLDTFSLNTAIAAPTLFNGGMQQQVEQIQSCINALADLLQQTEMDTAERDHLIKSQFSTIRAISKAALGAPQPISS